MGWKDIEAGWPGSEARFRADPETGPGKRVPGAAVVRASEASALCVGPTPPCPGAPQGACEPDVGGHRAAAFGRAA